MVYYEAWKEYETLGEERVIDPMWWFVFGITIIGFQKMLSSLTIFYLTRNWKASLLQVLDLLMVKAILINYQLNLDSPGNGQRYLELLVKYMMTIIANILYIQILCINII